MLTSIRSATEELATSLLDLAAGSTVWLAVTGLSRAGKTVFITSLIHNLLSAAHNPHRMPLLKVVGERRLLGARVQGGGTTDALPRFPYQANIDAMATAPWSWPPRTEGISEIEIDVRFMPAGTIGRLLGQLTGEPGSLKLKLVDYPGEWLIDLPLLGQTYAEWSRASLRLYRKGVRAEAAKEFLAFIAAHPHGSAASEEVARQAHDLYRAFLLKARDVHGLSYLQPGRFLCPGNLAAESYLWFAPLDMPDGEPATGTLGALMAGRYDVYRREVVEKFYQDHFRRYSRQIVLVDVLRALLAGADAFEDTRLALQAIFESFRYGRKSILAWLLGNGGIDRVLFAATKADHVPDIQRDHLAALQRNMVALPALDVTSHNAAFEVEAIASVISTAEDTQEIDGQRVQLVVGRPVGGDRQVKLFVGTIPIRPPRPDAWNSPFLNVPVFEPPAIDPTPVEGIPHIRLDSSLEYLLGDRLR